MAALDGRIGRIRFKNGVELRVIPNAKEAASKKAFEKLHRAVDGTEHHYGGLLDGYVLVVWDRDGYWSCFKEAGNLGHGNTLAAFVQGAVQRQIMVETACDEIERVLKNE